MASIIFLSEKISKSLQTVFFFMMCYIPDGTLIQVYILIKLLGSLNQIYWTTSEEKILVIVKNQKSLSHSQLSFK